MKKTIKTTLAVSLALLLSTSTVQAMSEGKHAVNRINVNQSEKLMNKLDLTQAQQDKIHQHFKATKEQRDQRHAIREANNGPLMNDSQRDQMRKARVENHKQFLKETLTPAQYEKIVEGKKNRTEGQRYHGKKNNSEQSEHKKRHYSKERNHQYHSPKK